MGGGGGRVVGRFFYGFVCAFCSFSFCLCLLNGFGLGCLDFYSKFLVNIVSFVLLVGNFLRLKLFVEGRLVGNWSWVSNLGFVVFRVFVEVFFGLFLVVFVFRVLSLLGFLGEIFSFIDSILVD